MLVSGGYPAETRYDDYAAGGGGGGGGPGYGDPYGPPGANDGYRNSLKGAPPPAAGDYRDGRTPGVGDGRAPPAYLPHQQQGAVLMVYGLDPLRTNTDKLFNLMCLYGNVARVSLSITLKLFIFYL